GRVELRHLSPGARHRSARDPHQGPTLAPLADPAGSPLGGYSRGRGRGETAVGPPTGSDPGRPGHPAGPARPGTAGGGRGPVPPSRARCRPPLTRFRSVSICYCSGSFLRIVSFVNDVSYLCCRNRLYRLFNLFLVVRRG